MLKRKLERARDIFKQEGMEALITRVIRSYLPPLIKILPAQTKSKVAKDATKFWNRSANSDYLRSASHWVGAGKWQEDEWLKLGNHHFAMFSNLCLVTNTKRPIQRMVEWGPGGGANAVRFATEVSEFYGVDISQPNLDECKRQLERIGFTGFHPVHIRTEAPEECLSQMNVPCDLFLATAVYTHFPSKEYGIRVTEIANKLLSPSGLAIIQIRYNDGSYKFKPKRDYNINWNEFTSYSLEEFWEITIDIGFKPLYLTLWHIDSILGHAYFLLQKCV